jgi:hypothetical protein
MSNVLNRFMEGKKKYSASVILPIIIAVIQVMVHDQATQSTLVGLAQEFLPTVIALVGGVAYTIMEGINDNTRLKNSASNSSVNGLPPDWAQNSSQLNVVNSGQASSHESPATSSILEPAPYPWNVQAFDEQVKKKAPVTYGVLNPSTELYQAMNSGVDAKCDYIEHAVDYWDYLVMKADARFSDIWGYSFREAQEKVQEPGCPTHPSTCGSFSSLKHKALALGEAYYTAYLDFERIKTKSLDIQSLAEYVKRGFNWKAALPVSNQNLYMLGELAAQLLKLCR